MKSQGKATILLMGTPNVGKSVIFNKLTGLNVSVANYAGTTVDVTISNTTIKDKNILMIDVPGTYTLDATNDAEKIAIEMLSGKSSFERGKIGHCDSTAASVEAGAMVSQKPSAVICVLDANNLEPSLYLLLQILEHGLPTVVALNRTDLAEEKGQIIDVLRLSHELGVTVVPMVAVTGEGLEKLKKALIEAAANEKKVVSLPVKRNNQDVRWEKTEKLVAKVMRQTDYDIPLQRKKLGDMLMMPWPGLPLAVLILAATFGIVVGLGMGLRQMVLLPLFRGLIIPQIVTIVGAIIPAGTIQNILIGDYGFLVKGVEWPFALVMPYVISFYIALSILEDSGYLPRLGCLLDGLLHKIGVHGSGIIPLFLGYGCGIPAIMATRALSSMKERKIITAMICLSVPCISQVGAFISLLAARSVTVMLAIFLVSIFALIITGIVLARSLKGSLQPVLMEVPELLLPRGIVLAKKIWIKTKNFVLQGEVPLIAAVGLAAVFYETGVMTGLGRLLSPLVVGWLQLPEEAAVPLLLGLFRRELTVLPLMEMDLTTVQLFVGAIVGLFYVPCVAIVAVVAREFNLSMAIKVLFFTTSIAFLLGGMFSRLGALFF